ncbi:hypothetical protein [Varunaivibrio sulfuroxidans]|uniref:Uncharacterized protein n=1 Tax=Varunaivibrio sulfuroxidans TaxID=1773489 RepID=A0A4R3J3S4_9PROT|nr:hypothetical protein [Varunaivibrio sulfuroxidans]TCS59845.1 hypothetical protein EDD55_1167 [Varunaivibrio sulfuroxidans]WES32013.1 hypothetical protein P3M64_06565 [Varunaivibrio sulfuroxidans]
MIVRYMRERRSNPDGEDPMVTFGKEYLVVDMQFSAREEGSCDVSVLCDDGGGPGILDLACFDFVDQRIPDNWVCQRLSNTMYRITPPEFMGHFWSEYNNADDEAEKTLKRVMQRIHEFHYPQNA